MKTTDGPRVIVIEDDVVVCDTLTMYLEQAGYAVSVARDGVLGLQLARQPTARLVILDLMIPGLPGQDVCRQLRAESGIPILMLTARASEDDRIAGLDLGADDYVPKPFSPREVVARVHALLRRTPAMPSMPPPPVRAGELEVHQWSRQARVGERVITLTPTEFRLLDALAAHAGRTYTRDELVARVFGPDFEGLDRTIDTHITNLRKKLDPDCPQRFVLTVHGVGYRLAGSHDRQS